MFNPLEGAIGGVSIHAPWEGCDTSALAVVHAIDVSIHAPWEGCDACSPRRFLRQIKFQFTHPGKGATSSRPRYTPYEHSFNSRTLGRVRRYRFNPFRLLAYQFQFTHPGKGATAPNDRQLHALSRFNSRTLGRVRRLRDLSALHPDMFQFTHPGKGATLLPRISAIGHGVSIHAPWEGCDLGNVNL